MYIKGVRRVEPIRDTFEERKQFIMMYLSNSINISKETMELFKYIEPIPFQYDSPLTDENMQLLKQCEDEEDVKSALKKIYSIQSEYEFRHMNEYIRNINRGSREIFSNLSLIVQDFKRFNNHPYQKDISNIFNELNDKKKELQEGIDTVLTHLKEWEKKKES